MSKPLRSEVSFNRFQNVESFFLYLEVSMKKKLSEKQKFARDLLTYLDELIHKFPGFSDIFICLKSYIQELVDKK